MMEPTHLDGRQNEIPRGRCCEGDEPDHSTNHDTLLPTKDIGEETRGKSTEEGTARHGSGDTALNISARTGARRRSIGSLVEVALVLFGAQTVEKC